MQALHADPLAPPQGAEVADGEEGTALGGERVGDAGGGEVGSAVEVEEEVALHQLVGGDGVGRDGSEAAEEGDAGVGREGEVGEGDEGGGDGEKGDGGRGGHGRGGGGGCGWSAW